MLKGVWLLLVVSVQQKHGPSMLPRQAWADAEVLRNVHNDVDIVWHRHEARYAKHQDGQSSTRPPSPALCLQDDKRILTASGDQTLALWDTSHAACLGVFKGHNGSVKCVRPKPDCPDVFASGLP